MPQEIFRYLGHFATFAYYVMSRPEITFEKNEICQRDPQNREKEMDMVEDYDILLRK